MNGLYQNILETEIYLPTPTKCHYMFNLRDISKIFEAVSRVKGNFYTREFFIKLWVHESFRTFFDRLVFDSDKYKFRDIINKQLDVNLGFSYKDYELRDNRDCMFVDFLNEGVYEEVNDFDELKKVITTKFSNDKAYSNMVFFDQAISNICILNRIMNKNVGGNGVLIGMGASGRKSYTRIASDLNYFKVNQMNSAKDLKEKDWDEFIRGIIRTAGLNSTPKVSVIINETDVSQIYSNIFIFNIFI